MKKALILSTMLTLFCIGLLAQSSQKGITLEYHGKKKKTALGNVMIVAGGSSCKSDANGMFALQFNMLKPGDKVEVNRIAKSGYVVFNKDALEQWMVSSVSHTFAIVLCKAEVFDEMVNTYYGVSMEYYERRLQAAKAEIEKMKREGKVKEVEYNNRLAEIDQQYQDALNELEDKAQIMARIDESEISDEDSRILALAKEGKIDEAIELIKKKDINEKLDKTIKKKQMAEEQEREARQAVEEAKHEIEVMIASLKNDIKVLSLAGGEENYKLCAEKWRSIIAANDTNINNVCEYLDFLCDQKYFDEGIALCEACEKKNYFNNGEMAAIYKKKGSLYHDAWKYDNAITAFEKSLELYGKENQEATIRDICFLKTVIAQSYMQLHDYQTAEQKLTPAVEAMREAVKENDNAENLKTLGRSLHVMAGIKKSNKQFDEAYKYIDEAISIAQRTLEANPEDNNSLSRLAVFLNRAATIRYSNAKYADALPMFLRSLEIQERLKAKNPRAYAFPVAQDQANVALSYWHLDKDSLGLEYAVKYLEGVSALAAENPKMYMPRKAEAYGTMSSILSTINLEEAIEKNAMAIELLEEYGKLYPEVYTDQLSEMYHNRGVLLDNAKRYAEAWEAVKKAIEIRSKKAEKEPDAYFAEWAVSLQVAVSILAELHRPDLADTLCTKAYELYKIEAERNPQLYGAKVGRLKTLLGIVKTMHATIYLDKMDCQMAERLFRESLDLYGNNTPTKMNLAITLALQGKNKEAAEIATPLKEAMFNKRISCADFLTSFHKELQKKGKCTEKQMKGIEELMKVFEKQ